MAKERPGQDSNSDKAKPRQGVRNQEKAMTGLNFKQKLPRRSSDAIVKKFMRAWFDLKEDGDLLFFGRAITQEVLANAALEYFLSLPRDEQIRYLREFIPHFEAMLTKQPPTPRVTPGRKVT